MIEIIKTNRFMAKTSPNDFLSWHDVNLYMFLHSEILFLSLSAFEEGRGGHYSV